MDVQGWYPTQRPEGDYWPDYQNDCGGARLPVWLVPKGNTGGANVSPVKPMDYPSDLKPLLADYSVWSDVRRRLLFLAIVVVGLILAGDVMRAIEASRTQSDWDRQDM